MPQGLPRSVFRVPLIVAFTLLIAFGGGIVSALSMLNASVGFGAIDVAGWRAYPAAQTVSADPYAKAHRAKAGLLLYGSAEGLQFSATKDSKGLALTGTCSYRISGRTPAARAWTLYAGDDAGQPLVAGEALPVAKNSQTIIRRRDGSFDIAVSRTAQAGNWLAIPDTGTFQLILTLLDTPAAASTGLSGLDMPVIEQIGCGNE